MNRVIDFAFLLSASLALIKLGDLALRPHQEKWLKEKLETLTLKLSYQKPLYRLFNYLSKPSVFWLITFIVGAPLAHELGKPLFMITRQTDILIYFALIVLSLPNFKKATDITKPTVQYLAGELEPIENYGFPNYLSRFVLTILRYTLISVVLSGVCYLAFKIYLVVMQGQSWAFDSTLARLSLIPMWPFIFFLYTIVVAGVFVILGWVGLMIAYLGLVFLRAVLWRIVEFNKGPVGAILIIITAILGATDVFLRLKK